MENLQIGSAVLQKTALDPFHSIMAYPFVDRPTIVIVVVCDNKVLFVKPAKGDRWILPQGGISRSDFTLMGAALREGHQELGMQKELVLPTRRIVLGECLNPIPSERGLGYTHKQLFFMLLPVRHRDWVKLNDENTRYDWVASRGHLMALWGKAAESMSVKLQATCEALRNVASVGLLSWASNIHEETAPALA